MAQKIVFFTELFRLDEDEEETEDPEDAAVILKQFKPLRQSRQCEQRAFLRCETSSPLSNTSVVEASSPLIQLPSEPSRRPPRVKAKVTPKKKGKRKRGQSLELLSDSQQIFKGLEFYFIPNNDISPARRFRIKKAVERGALWVREWRTDVTHVIADKTLTYKDIITFLKLSSIPPHVALVTEDYPAACISSQRVLNPNQFRYYVEGFQQPLRIEGLSYPISSDAKMTTSYNEVTGGTKQSGRAETALCTIPVDANSTFSEGLSRGVSPEPDSESSQVSPRQGPASENVGSAANGSKAGFNTMISKAPSKPSRDALDEAIEEAAAFKDLPLDCDEDLELIEPVADETDDEHSRNEGREMRLKRRRPNKDQPWQENFSCMHKHDGTDKGQNPNSRTIEVLQKMLEYYDRTKDHWRILAYRKAISALRKHSTKVVTEEEASNIPFIGQRLAVKIEEIVRTDRLRRLENTSLEPNDLTLQRFLKIYGVGLSQATRWINQGYRTLGDLVSKAHLTKNQLIGIEHYDDFQARIPRAEVESHGEFVRTIIHEVDPTIEVTVGGSYRRGAPDSGDVDFIITKPNCAIGILRTIIFDTVLPILQERGYIKATLVISSSNKNDEDNSGGRGSKWHGAAALPPGFGFAAPASLLWRRIDFLLVPWDEMGAALLYFTGNDIFNRSIRLLARKKHMRLNQHGLWRDVIGGPRDGGRRVTRGTLLEGRSEERIFELLGVPFRPPEHRIC